MRKPQAPAPAPFSCRCTGLLAPLGRPWARGSGRHRGRLRPEKVGIGSPLTPSLWHMAPPPASGSASGSPFSMATSLRGPSGGERTNSPSSLPPSRLPTPSSWPPFLLRPRQPWTPASVRPSVRPSGDLHAWGALPPRARVAGGAASRGRLPEARQAAWGAGPASADMGGCGPSLGPGPAARGSSSHTLSPLSPFLTFSS